MNPVVLDQVVRQQEEINSLRQQLAECERERDELVAVLEDFARAALAKVGAGEK